MAWKPFDEFAGTSVATPRCYESHPTLKLGKGKLYGGSASWPVKKADIYVALQKGSTCGATSDPWEDQTVVEIHFGIQDMGVPSDIARFKKMVTWLCKQLQHGKKVHVGCIGGHGRTGTLITAIVATLLKEKDAIQWVRAHYCERAVESTEQVQFLMKHYGVTHAKGHKAGIGKIVGGSYDGTRKPLSGVSGHSKGYAPPVTLKALEGSVSLPPVGVTSETRTFAPMASSRSIWRHPR